MLNRNFFMGALLALSVSFLVAFSSAKTESNAVYEYVIIDHSNNYDFTVNEQGKEFVKFDVPTKRKNDLNPVYELVNKYEAAGWELYQTHTFASSPTVIHTSFTLRRKKQ